MNSYVSVYKRGGRRSSDRLETTPPVDTISYKIVSFNNMPEILQQNSFCNGL